MDRFVTRTKVSCIILGIALTILGLAFFVNPVSATIFVTLCIGWAFVIAGVVTLVAYVRSPAGMKNAADLALSILEFVLGVLILIWPGAFALYLFVLIGVIIVITGIFDIVEALSMRNVVESRWGLWLALGIITLIFGVLVFVAPFAFAEALMIVAGIALVYDGITEIIVGIRL